MALLRTTDSVYPVYLLIGISSLFAFLYNRKSNYVGSKVCIGLALMFAAMVILANYSMILSFGGVEKVYSLILLPIGGFCAFYNVLVWLRSFVLRFNLKTYKYKIPAKKVFLLSFGALCLVYLLALVLCCKPGVLTADSVNQIDMIDNGAYSDHHPFYHTMLIRLFYGTAMAIFGNRDVAIFCYCAAQAIMMAAIFAYVATTLYQLRLNKKIVIAVLAVFAFLPCHLLFSFTMWKDVLFSGGVLLFVVALYRYLKNIGDSQIRNVIFALLGALMICLLRSNGFYAFIVLALVFFVLYRKTHLKMAIALLGALVVSFGLKMLVPAMGVVSTEPTEFYSIPLQQQSRVVVEDGNLTDEQRQKIEELAPAADIKARYLPYISDPIKGLVRDRGMEPYLAKNRKEFLGLWASVGIKNPKLYVQAWVDQTRGYWNGGYYYWNVTLQNDLDPSRAEHGGFFYKLLSKYCDFFNNFSVTRVLLSIGLFVWVTIIVLYLAFVKGDKELAFLTLAPLGVIATLLISTPVFAEFRYAYAVFCCVPFLLPVLFVGKAKKAKRSKK